MTAIQRWGKAVMYSIFVALVVMLTDYLTGDFRADYHAYYMVGLGFFLGWLGGGAEERKATKLVINE
jgi:hypothetical protein